MSAMPLAQLPTWKHGMEGDCILPRSYMLRVMAVADGPRSWRVLPGGLTRIASAALEIASMQRGGSSREPFNSPFAHDLVTGRNSRT